MAAIDPSHKNLAAIGRSYKKRPPFPVAFPLERPCHERTRLPCRFRPWRVHSLLICGHLCICMIHAGIKTSIFVLFI
jgi:hypothetical protein